MWRIVFGVLLWASAFSLWAAPDRAGLIQAWETEMRRDGQLEAVPDGGYRYINEGLGYDGPVKIVAALVQRQSAMLQADKQLAASGTVDFELSDWDETVRNSVAVLSWKAERQQFVYRDQQQDWLPMMGYYRERYGYDSHDEGEGPVSYQSQFRRFGDLWLLLGLCVVVIGLLVLVARQARKARDMYAEARDINRLARENIERARVLHEANAAAVRESLELARRKAETLEAILAEIRRGKPGASD